jgi:hypothetical protein
MKIQPQLLTLDQLLQGRLFRIPEYQRSYSWGAKQRADLFSDILRLAARGASAAKEGRPDDESHFMATIVGLRREVRTIRTTPFQHIDVVDGQQRLTTLVVLLKALQGALDRDDEDQGEVERELKQLLIKRDDVAPVLLQTNHDSSRYCVTYLRDGKHPEPAAATTAADRHLLNAMTECEAFVAQWRTTHPVLELVAVVKNKLQFLFHELEDEATVYTVFEVLNSRGLGVSWFDRLKSILMGLAFEAKMGNEKETVKELHQIWRDIYGCIGLRQGLSAETLKFGATLWCRQRPNRVIQEEDAVTLLREAAQASPAGVVDVSNWLLRLARAVDGLAADRRLNGVTRISQARLLATAILLRDDLEPAAKSRLMLLWERVSFRIYGMYRRDSRTRVGEYIRLAWSVGQQKIGADEIERGLRALGSEFPIAGAVATLRDSDCYGDWQPELRYLLFRYEEHLAAQRGQKFENEQWNRIWESTAAESIEHVTPQSRGSGEKSATGIFVHRLGNLVLLPPRLNSKLQDREPDKKADEYVNTGLHQAVDVAGRVRGATPWDRAAVVKREEELLAWAATHWGD